MGLRSYLRAKREEGFFHVNRGMIPIELAYMVFNLGGVQSSKKKS